MDCNVCGQIHAPKFLISVYQDIILRDDKVIRKHGP